MFLSSFRCLQVEHFSKAKDFPGPKFLEIKLVRWSAAPKSSQTTEIAKSVVWHFGAAKRRRGEPEDSRRGWQ